MAISKYADLLHENECAENPTHVRLLHLLREDPFPFSWIRTPRLPFNSFALELQDYTFNRPWFQFASIFRVELIQKQVRVRGRQVVKSFNCQSWQLINCSG